ncbi:MAG: NAD(P)-dependent oxidoreductase [Saprospiraceae bacterium]
MKILLTGASGFLGSYVLNSLLSKGYPVVILTRNIIENTHPNLMQILVDLKNFSFVQSIPTDIEIVIHTAQSNEYASDIDSADDIFSINVSSTFQLINWSFLNKVKKFIFTSTGSVYESSPYKLRENSSCVPNNLYGASKLCAEILLRSFSKQVDIKVYRIFYLFGNGQKNKLISNMYYNLINSNPITIDSDGGMRFNPLYVEDCVEIILQEIEKVSENGYSVFNLAGKEEINLETLVNQLGKIIEHQTTIRNSNNLPKSFVANTEMLSNYYNTQNFHSINSALKLSFSSTT